MSDNQSSSTGTMLLTFLAGAAVGAVVVALTTPKSGPDLRGNLRDMARRAKFKAEDLADDASGAWDDLKDSAALAVEDVRRNVTAAAKDLRS
jgi:gas vesicle protein